MLPVASFGAQANPPLSEFPASAASLPAECEAGLAAYVTALLNWHRRNRFCANCGAPIGARRLRRARRIGRGGHGHSDGGEPVATDGELEEVRWVDLDTVRAATAGKLERFRLPPPISIARYLVERWVAGKA